MTISSFFIRSCSARNSRRRSSRSWASRRRVDFVSAFGGGCGNNGLCLGLSGAAAIVVVGSGVVEMEREFGPGDIELVGIKLLLDTSVPAPLSSSSSSSSGAKDSLPLLILAFCFFLGGCCTPFRDVFSTLPPSVPAPDCDWGCGVPDVEPCALYFFNQPYP